MLFNSYIYIFAFLPFAFFLFSYLKRKTTDSKATFFLMFLSLIFYSYWEVSYLPLLLGSIVINYFLGIKLSSGHLSLRYLVFGIILNLSPLFYFKYYDFFIENLNIVFKLNLERLYLELPLAISFFTFQQIAYLVDSYKKITKEQNFTSYALFVSFFPQLIAGPIVHHKEMMDQFDKELVSTDSHISKALILFSIGLFKKVVIADSFIFYVSNGFDKVVALDFFEAWYSSLAYTLQLYFDFSGYSDMAIASAFLFGIILPENFNSPYQSRNIQDFWRRWHITLGRWLKDYIYIPLGGNRHGDTRMYLALFITFLVGGIWHGAGWNFLIWGCLHGLGLVVFQFISKKFSFYIPKYLAIAITFIYVHFAWVFFRAPSFKQAWSVLKSMVGLQGFSLPRKICDRFFQNTELTSCLGEKVWLSNLKTEDETSLYLIFLLTIPFLLAFCFPNSKKVSIYIYQTKWARWIAPVIFLTSVIFLTRESKFLYFQF